MLALPHGAAETAWNRASRRRRATSGWPGRIRRQVRRDADRPHARAAAAVRNRERLVQIQVADVGADRRRARQPDLRVHVGAVHVHLPAVLVDDVADGADLVLEDAVRRGIGDHQARQPVAVLRGLAAAGRRRPRCRSAPSRRRRRACRPWRRWPDWCRAPRPESARRRDARSPRSR